MIKFIRTKIYDRLMLYFKGELLVDTEKIGNFIFTYNVLKNDFNILTFLDEDITIAIENIKAILLNDFDSTDDIQNVPLAKYDAYIDKRLMYWLSDNGNMLKEPNLEIQEFNKLSYELISRYNKLIKFRSNDVYYRYNIRILKPYIINMVEIRKTLLSYVP